MSSILFLYATSAQLPFEVVITSLLMTGQRCHLVTLHWQRSLRWDRWNHRNSESWVEKESERANKSGEIMRNKTSHASLLSPAPHAVTLLFYSHLPFGSGSRWGEKRRVLMIIYSHQYQTLKFSYKNVYKYLSGTSLVINCHKYTKNTSLLWLIVTVLLWRSGGANYM